MHSSDGAGDVEGTRIEFNEDLDLATAGILHEQIITARSTHAGSRPIVVDLSQVGFMDSVGISLLVSAYRRATEEGTRIRLILPSRLRKLFEISGLIEVLKPEFVSEQEATAQ